MVRSLITAARRRLVRGHAAEDGLSLIEMMAAILLLGIILTALAGTIVASLRSVSRSEREVIAASVHTQQLEELQAIEYSLAVLYADDVAALPVLADHPDTSKYATIPGPGLAARDPRIPEAHYNETRNGIDYQIDRYIINEDTSGDGIEDVKRFITVITWDDISGGTRSSRVESVRTPTQDDLGSGLGILRTLLFDIAAAPMPTKDNGPSDPKRYVNQEALQGVIILDGPADVVTVQYYHADGTGSATSVAATLLNGVYTFSVGANQLASDTDGRLWEFRVIGNRLADAAVVDEKLQVKVRTRPEASLPDVTIVTTTYKSGTTVAGANSVCVDAQRQLTGDIIVDLTLTGFKEDTSAVPASPLGSLALTYSYWETSNRTTRADAIATDSGEYLGNSDGTSAGTSTFRFTIPQASGREFVAGQTMAVWLRAARAQPTTIVTTPVTIDDDNTYVFATLPIKTGC